MANVLFSRTDSPSTKPITDGQIIFDTSGNGKMYLDNGTTRLEMGGAINVDATLDATSTNPIQNKGVAGVMLSELEEVRGVTKKGFLTDALATKTLDAKIGTTDISSIGDGTVTGAINAVNGKLENKLSYHRDGIKGYYNEYYTASFGFIILEDYVPYEGTSIANWEAIKFTNNLINAPLVSVSNIIRANGSTQYILELMVDTKKNIYLRNSSGSNIDISNGVTGYLMFLI